MKKISFKFAAIRTVVVVVVVLGIPEKVLHPPPAQERDKEKSAKRKLQGSKKWDMTSPKKMGKTF